MPVMHRAVDVVSRRLPKVFSPEAHEAADFILAGAFAAAGAWFWRTNRRAALGSWFCGASLVGLTLATTYPGKHRKYIGLRVHRRLETGMATMVAAMPELLHLDEHDKERHYFTIKAGLLTAISNLTMDDPLR